MGCNQNWTIRFATAKNKKERFEVRPVEMSLKLSRRKYNFCRADLSFEAGEMMKPETRYSDGKLYGLTRAEVRYNGTTVQHLFLRPDWVEYGDNFTEIELKDLHKSLSSGTVDIQRDAINLKDIYNEVVSKAPNNPFGKLTEKNFTLPDTQVRTLVGNGKLRGSGGAAQRSRIERDKTARLLESTYAVDFEDISPEKAIERLNQKFNIYSWVNRDGDLIIGLPEAKKVRHIAAPDDSRAWRYKDVNIRHGRKPVRSVKVEGAWIDEPGIGTPDDAIDEVASWFNLADNNKKGGADVKAVGYAERTDIDYGQDFTITSTKAKRDALPTLAEIALIERMKKQNNGSVGIDPDLSGTKYSNPIDLQPGDFLHLVPDDRYFDNPTADSGSITNKPDLEEVCGGYVNNEIYLVTGVEHEIGKTGDWNVSADVSIFPDMEIKSSMYYFNPETGERVPKSSLGENPFENL